jgi:hypothetical protein
LHTQGRVLDGKALEQKLELSNVLGRLRRYGFERYAYHLNSTPAHTMMEMNNVLNIINGNAAAICTNQFFCSNGFALIYTIRFSEATIDLHQ